jgi:hypothetical protein
MSRDKVLSNWAVKTMLGLENFQIFNFYKGMIGNFPNSHPLEYLINTQRNTWVCEREEGRREKGGKGRGEFCCAHACTARRTAIIKRTEPFGQDRTGLRKYIEILQYWLLFIQVLSCTVFSSLGVRPGFRTVCQPCSIQHKKVYSKTLCNISVMVVLCSSHVLSCHFYMRQLFRRF